jgi:hypothetical protein
MAMEVMHESESHLNFLPLVQSTGCIRGGWSGAPFNVRPSLRLSKYLSENLFAPPPPPPRPFFPLNMVLHVH